MASVSLTDRILASAYRPWHDENRMANEGNVEAAREHFYRHRPANLWYLLETRYTWMNQYLPAEARIVEFGSGAGFSREFIQRDGLRLTDVEKYPWIDEVADALDPPYEDESLDAVILSHVLHHVARPMAFFERIARILKPDGHVLIAEIHASLFMRALLRIARHEGWDFGVDVFDRNSVANDPNDPWSANCAIPRLLFGDAGRFEQEAPTLQVVRNELCECLIFPLSGGVIAKSPTVHLPRWLLRIIEHLDRILVRSAPCALALGRRVVLRKRSIARSGLSPAGEAVGVP